MKEMVIELTWTSIKKNFRGWKIYLEFFSQFEHFPVNRSVFDFFHSAFYLKIENFIFHIRKLPIAKQKSKKIIN